MANEAAVAVVVRMRDEASPKMQQFGQNMNKASQSMQQTQVAALEMKVAVLAAAQVFSQLSSLLGQIDNPAAKAASRFLNIANYIILTGVAIQTFLPMIKSLIIQLRSLAVAKALVSAFSGPVGWIGLGVGAAAVGGVTALALSNRGREGGGQHITVTNNIGGSVIAEREIGEITRREIVKVRQRNGSSGIE